MVNKSIYIAYGCVNVLCVNLRTLLEVLVRLAQAAVVRSSYELGIPWELARCSSAVPYLPRKSSSSPQ